MRKLFLGIATTVAFLSTSAKAETTNCREITSVPVIITVQGIYCLKSDKSSSQTSGNVIDIRTNNVTIDLNGFKLGGLGAGPATNAIGINATNRQNITIRNGSIRGFGNGIILGGGSGHLVEDLLLDGNRQGAINLSGAGHVVRNNRVVNTGGTGSQAIAIVASGRNTVIADNIVSDTSAGGDRAEAILLVQATLFEIRNNTILDTSGGIVVAVEVNTSTNVTVINNRVLNTTVAGSAGIVGVSATGLNCINNTVAGFSGALVNCNAVSGNVTP